ncbi:hypothetical protein PVAP13_7KG114400 [Panicum virgatum]|uniref:Uncharacterized protein n=1 Tax=Panicum virgatum TaxID=38727 RepID=A0A8T0QFP5_PANVG|nr:hypothetical protein PVAP13_7KG114400 [Panicum virgatum]
MNATFSSWIRCLREQSLPNDLLCVHHQVEEWRQHST